MAIQVSKDIPLKYFKYLIERSICLDEFQFL